MMGELESEVKTINAWKAQMGRDFKEVKKLAGDRSWRSQRRQAEEISNTNNLNNLNIIKFSISKPRRLLARQERKSYSSTIKHDAYAAHGVLETITPSNFSTEDAINVGIIASSWPGWAIPFSHTRYSLQWIVTFNCDLLQILRRCFPSILVLSFDQLDFSRLASVDILAFNGPFTRLLNPPESASLLLFDWNMWMKTGWEKLEDAHP